MLDLLDDVLGYILMSLLFGGLWEFASFFIIYFLCKIKNKEIPDDFGNNYGLYWLTNSILIFFCLLIFYK